MDRQEHLIRAASFERSLTKLDPLEDGALYVVYLMRAGTNRVNAALHALGITDVQASPGRVGDLNHTYKPKLEGELPAEVKRMFEPLSLIENLRPAHVRGAVPLTADLVEACRRAYDDIRMRTSAILDARREEAAG